MLNINRNGLVHIDDRSVNSIPYRSGDRYHRYDARYDNHYTERYILVMFRKLQLQASPIFSFFKQFSYVGWVQQRVRAASLLRDNPTDHLCDNNRSFRFCRLGATKRSRSVSVKR
jgi:hypothetical protein